MLNVFALVKSIIFAVHETTKPVVICSLTPNPPSEARVVVKDKTRPPDKVVELTTSSERSTVFPAPLEAKPDQETSVTTRAEPVGILKAGGVQKQSAVPFEGDFVHDRSKG